MIDTKDNPNTITLPYPPSANRYWRHGEGRVYVSAEANAYRLVVGLRARQMGLRPIDGDVSVTLKVYRPRKAGDIDNSCKILLDALQGTAYRNDKQIAEIHAYRFDDKHNPRVEVWIEPC